MLLMEKKIILLVFVLVIMINSTGCWNYVEINEKAIVMGMAIDKGTDHDQYSITVELIRAKSGEIAAFESEIIMSEGETVFDAVRNAISTSGRKLYWSHIKILIISRAIAEAGILPVLDLANRDAEFRHDMFILISEEATAKKILLESTSKLYDTVSYNINETLKAEKHISKYYGLDLWTMINDLSAMGTSLVLPAIKLNERNGSPQVFGSAVFNGDKLVGSLSSIETRSMLFVKSKVKGGIIVVKNIGNTGTDVSLEIFGSKSKVYPIVVDDEIVMINKINIEAAIGEISGTENVIDKDKRKVLKEEAKALIKKEILDTINKAQEELNADIFGYGNIIERKLPNEWKKIENSWDVLFSSLEKRVEVEINITRSGLTSKPLKKGNI